MEENGFTVLENKTIGHNMSLYRKIRGIKAMEVAEGLGIKEAAYTRYERGEAGITVDIIQKVAEIIKVDPMMLLSVPPSSFIENGSNSPNSANAPNYGSYIYQTYNEKQMEMTLKLMENVMAISQKLIDMLNKQGM
jgi:transcriptional regulator with XRE-family HTH domain